MEISGWDIPKLPQNPMATTAVAIDQIEDK